MDIELIKKQILHRKEELMHYVPTNFFRKNQEESFEFFITKPILDGEYEVYTIEIDGSSFNFLYKFLKWDSEYFKMPTIKLEYILFESSDFSQLEESIRRFLDEVVKTDYIFCEIPSEDIYVMQALNKATFQLIETRMTYYLALNQFENTRFDVREATKEDVPNLKRVAADMVNPFDRFHADRNFDHDIANEFLGTFAEASVNGFADYVMIPNEDGVPSDSFLTAKYYKDWWEAAGVNVSKMVLSAVSSDTNRGWYLKLISEMAYHLKGIGADYAVMHPASTNKAVIHTYEKLGCKLGKVSHIFSLRKND